MEYRLKSLELSILKGVIGEHLARSFIRNTLAPKLEEEEKWDHVVFSRNDYKQSNNAWNEKLFSYDRFREDFYSHGFCADRQLLSKYAMVVGVLGQNHCTPDGLLLKLQETEHKRRVEKDFRFSNVRLRNRFSNKREEASMLPVVKGDLEIVEIKCGRGAKLMEKQKETYNDLIWKGVPVRLVEVRIVSFDARAPTSLAFELIETMFIDRHREVRGEAVMLIRDNFKKIPTEESLRFISRSLEDRAAYVRLLAVELAEWYMKDLPEGLVTKALECCKELCNYSGWTLSYLQA